MVRFFSILILAASVGCGKSSSSQAGSCNPGEMAVARKVVKVNSEVFSSNYKQFIVSRKATSSRGAKVETVQLDDENQRMDKIQQWLGDDEVEYVEPDYPIELEESVSDDPFVGKQWALDKMQTSQAWDLTAGNKKVTVAVIDSGVDIRHPDLAANIWTNPKEVLNGKDDDGNGYVDDIHGWDFAHNDNSPTPDSAAGSSHGTHVAGIIGAVVDNGVGVAGVAPDVRIMPLRFIPDDGGGMTSNAAKAVYYAIDKKVDVINMSFGSTHFSQAFYDALTKAQAAGITIVVASGNSKLNLNNHEWYPTKYPQSNIITVAATNSHDEMWLSSSQGSNYSTKYVDVAAPGVSIYSTVNAGKYGTKTGTSMAAPVVSALAVLLKGRDATLTPQEISVALKKSSEPLPNLASKVASGGRVNAYDAVELASRKSLLAADVAGDQCAAN